MKDLQHYVSSEYPPTHAFNTQTMKPAGILSERQSIIDRNFSSFFTGKRLLDIGCSKGYFSITNAKNFREVVGIDKDSDAIYACNRLKEIHGVNNVKFRNMSFREFHDSETYDRIFIGNTHHHIFSEINGHEWINKLAALSSDLVLIEGPYNTACPDINSYPLRFNDFMGWMADHFIMKNIIPTVSYTPGRYFMLWKRRKLKLDPDKRYIKKLFKHDRYVSNNMVDIFIASTSPISNGLSAFGSDGWYEEYDGSGLYVYFENERELFKLHCMHQRYLLKLGYIDIDSATINYFKPSNTMFDKSGVVPFLKFGKKHINRYFRLLNQSYRTIPDSVQKTIREFMERKDMNKLAGAYLWAEKEI